jgi:hypothetical protein
MRLAKAVDEHHGEERELMVEASATTAHQHDSLRSTLDGVAKCEFGIALVLVHWVADDVRAECSECSEGRWGDGIHVTDNCMHVEAKMPSDFRPRVGCNDEGVGGEHSERANIRSVSTE